MVGGGEGSFIGPVHRMAAQLDGRIELVCGAFSSDPERSRRSGVDLYGLSAASSYADYEQMFAQQAAKPVGERMDFVTIVTPNHLHFPVAQAALNAGFHVVCDKPVTHRLQDALHLRALVERTGLHFAVTYNYTGYPMVQEARELVRSGALGAIRRINCEYLQGWLAADLDNKQANWRVDPDQAGVAGCFSDIGSHAENLIAYISGEELDMVAADLNRFVPGRRLDDDGNVLLRFGSGARGVMCASQIAVGEENNLHLRIYGEHGSIEWAQMEPNTLLVRLADGSTQVRRTGSAGVSPAAQSITRLPAGHPEGYLEAFATVYGRFADAIGSGVASGNRAVNYPTIDDGVASLRFISCVVESSERDGAWVSTHEEAAT